MTLVPLITATIPIPHHAVAAVQATLVGAAQRIKANASSCFAFPRCTDHTRCNANSASNALNKWLHANFRNDIVIHGFRHAMRDRLRAVSCPSEMIDQIRWMVVWKGW